MTKLFFRILIPVTFMLGFGKINAQTVDQLLVNKPWKASWIAVPDESATGYGVYYFRKNFTLKSKPSSFLIHVSADNRYKLYVNQTLVSLGPARGDFFFWNYETVDLAPYLISGKNNVSAVVWNEGEDHGEAQMSIRTAFIMQGKTANEDLINTNTDWKCIRDKGYQPTYGLGYRSYYVAGPGESVDMNLSLKGWNTGAYNDSNWKNAKRIDAGNPKGTVNASGWMLVPSAIPQMELKEQRILSVRKAEGIAVPALFPMKKTALTIPANTKVTLLLDQQFLTNAFLTLNFSKGKNAGIRIGYAEALFVNLNGPEGDIKGNRNDVEHKIFAGRSDSVTADGALNNSFRSFIWRTFRYILLCVVKQKEPLVIDDIYGTFTGYPFTLNSKIETGDSELQQILDIGWRTARLCAGESYMDCPYYEQLQYVGDTRIQALVSFYNSGDDRLVRNSLNQIDHSRIAEGLTLSRYPSASTQIIPTFSLWYIGMLHDYWMYRPDGKFVKDKIEGVRGVLAFFKKHQQIDGSLKNTPYWTFVDWVNNKDWDFGMAPKSTKGSSAILDLQLMWAYEQAAAMELKIGLPAFAAVYSAEAAELKRTIQQKYWDAGRKLYADTEDKKLFSQHTNALAILTNMVSKPEARSISLKLQEDTSLTQCTIYFKYYLHQAMIKGGLGDHYLQWLGVWRQSIKAGFTTWPETSDLDRARSDCHAWGASPNIEFYRTVLGIDSDAPGFRTIKIEPHLGDIKVINGEMPHPEGKIKTSYAFNNGKWTIKITIPSRTKGFLVWKGKTYQLKEGDNLFIV